MEFKNWEKLNKHIENKFSDIEKIEEYNTFPSRNNFKTLEDYKLYKITCACIAIDIINSKQLFRDFYDKKEKISKIFSEFVNGINKILNINHAKYIRIQGDSIYAIFKVNKRQDIDNILDCATQINTFKIHLNKQIYKLIFNQVFDDNCYIDYGIGIWFSFDNYFTIIGTNTSRDIVFIGDSVNYASALSKIATREGKNPIMFNDLFLTNISNDYRKKNKDIFDFKQYNILDFCTVYGCDWVQINYLNWIKNNI